MSIVPKRDYIILLGGDVLVFLASLWLSLAFRELSVPSRELFFEHVVPFALLFAVWVFIFFLAGLYARHTRYIRARLPRTIFYTQTINMVVAALFFFFIPYFGIAPKTILAIYLLVSSVLIFGWRVYVFPALRTAKKAKALLIASGPDVEDLIEEVGSDEHYPFAFETVLNAESVTTHELVQHVVRAAEDKNGTIIVADITNPIMDTVLPIMYNSAFARQRLVLIDVNQLYQDVFNRVPLSLLRYEAVLPHLSVSTVYDMVKRVIDIVLGIIGCAVSFLFLYPLVALAIKLEDGGEVFIAQERIGQFQQPFRMLKFRSMSGNDKDTEVLKSKHTVTRVGRFMRRFHIDEAPQFWNLLKGDLSFVGPRPELPALANYYSARIPYYNARHLIAPGLTGWARLQHRRDPHHGTDVDETKNKLAYDLYYLKNRSLILDIYIIFQTVKILVTARGL